MHLLTATSFFWAISHCPVYFYISGLLLPFTSFFFPLLRFLFLSFLLQTVVSLAFSSILSFSPCHTFKCFFCLSNPPNPSWASFMKMQIHSRAGKNVNRRKLPCSTNQKRRTIKNRQQQPGDPNSVQPLPEIATHACINPLQAKNMWLKELCCHLLLRTTSLPQKRHIYHPNVNFYI